MARVGEEGARVGDHADEAAEQAEVGQRVHLVAHAAFLVEEPPARAILDLARRHAVLERAREAGEQGGVGGVEIVEDRLPERVLARERAEPADEARALAEVADRVAAGV